ncbi:MAG: hypothetical protein ACT4PW_09915 [Acidimicrobiia bacterium]
MTSLQGRTQERPSHRPPSTTASRRWLAMVAALAVLATVSAGCGNGTSRPVASSSSAAASASPPVVDPGDGGRYEPDIDPADFVDRIDNPYMPLAPGSRWVYEGESDGEPERVEVFVTPQRRQIMGISAVVVRDTVTIGGEIVEDTYDWFAQDRDGNVWYLGEDVKDFEDGKLVSTAGSFEAGVDGAQAGIVMPATAAVGDAYRQEFYPGEAEDMAEVLQVGASATVRFGTFGDVRVTEEWTPLEPETVEQKSFAPGVGLIRSVVTAGGEGGIELVDYQTGL